MAATMAATMTMATLATMATVKTHDGDDDDGGGGDDGDADGDDDDDDGDGDDDDFVLPRRPRGHSPFPRKNCPHQKNNSVPRPPGAGQQDPDGSTRRR